MNATTMTVTVMAHLRPDEIGSDSGSGAVGLTRARSGLPQVPKNANTFSHPSTAAAWRYCGRSAAKNGCPAFSYVWNSSAVSYDGLPFTYDSAGFVVHGGMLDSRAA